MPIYLRLGDREVPVLPKIDTGADYCVFQRIYGEQLGLDVPTGNRIVMRTVAGEFEAFGHSVTIQCFEWDIDAMVYFSAEEGFSRNVLGRSGWLQKFRVGIVEYDTMLYLSDYND